MKPLWEHMDFSDGCIGCAKKDVPDITYAQIIWPEHKSPKSPQLEKLDSLSMQLFRAKISHVQGTGRAGDPESLSKTILAAAACTEDGSQEARCAVPICSLGGVARVRGC